MRTKAAPQTETLEVHFSADPDDAFAWWAALEGSVTSPGIILRGVAGNVHRNNIACQQGIPHIAAISAASYPAIADSYAILSSGASVARGYGPALIARQETSLNEALVGPIAVAGLGTTGGTLLQVLFAGTPIVEMSWKQIPDAVAAGDVSAGVAIHETLLMWRRKGLHRLTCLGNLWQDQTGLPIPVGLVVARRSLGTVRLSALSRLLRRSVEYAFIHRDGALQYASQYSLAPQLATMEQFIDNFTNDDTVELPSDAIEGLQLFYHRMHEAGLCPQLPVMDLVYPALEKELSPR